MSELLDEAKKRLEQAKRQRTRNSHKSFDYGVVIGWKAAVTLIIKHEQPALTEEQEKIYWILKFNRSSHIGIPVEEGEEIIFYNDPSSVIKSLLDLEPLSRFHNEDFVPALRKFLNEVEK